MEKEVRSFKIEYPLDWTYGVEISKIRADLDAVEKLGATHIQIEHGIAWDSSYVEIDAISERLETDEELRERISEAQKLKDRIKKAELDQLEKLKAKYNQP